jgi:uncharacterized protein
MQREVKKWVRFLGVFCLVMTFFVVSTQTSWGIDKSKYPKQIVFRAGSVGGPWVPMSTMVADEMMKKFPGLNIIVQPGGGLSNIRIIEKGIDSVIGFCHAPLLWEAKGGTLDKGKTYGNISAVMSTTASTQQMAVRAKSDIRTFTNLKDKRICCGKKGTGGEITCRRVLEAYGITYKSIRNNGGTVSFVDHTEMGMAMKDRILDFVNLSGNAPHAVLQEIETVTPIRLLSIDNATLKKIKQKYPFYAVEEVPAGTLKGMKEPATALLNVATLIVHKSLSDEFVYEITKLLIEKGPELYKAMPFIDRLSPPKRALSALDPKLMHPSAVKYFKEIGVLK